MAKVSCEPVEGKEDTYLLKFENTNEDGTLNGEWSSAELTREDALNIAGIIMRGVAVEIIFRVGNGLVAK